MYINGTHSAFYQAGRRKGLEDTWSAARKIICAPCDGGYEMDVLSDLFDEIHPEEILKNFSAEEAIEKISGYEQQISNYNNIAVGSEVVITTLEDRVSGVVVKVAENGLTLFSPSELCTYHIQRSAIKTVTLTGKVFGDIAEIMNKN